MEIKISIIIPAYNNTSLTKNCLISIIENTYNDNYEIIVIDNGSGMDFIQEIKTMSFSNSKIKYVRNEINLGFAKACNQGAKIANGKYLVFLNNDTLIMNSEWLNELIEPLIDNQEIAICGAKLLYPDKTIQHGGIGFFKGNPIHLYRNKKHNYPPANRKKFLNAVTAACFSINKTDFFDIGQFDENFINGFEDVDFCLRTISIGKKILFNPACELIHLEEKTIGRKDKDKFNFDLLVRKHSFFPDDLKMIFQSDGVKLKNFFISLLPNKGKMAGYSAFYLDRGFSFVFIHIIKKLLQGKS